MSPSDAEVIGVACPYCQQMLEETVRSMGMEIEVMDLAEVLAASPA